MNSTVSRTDTLDCLFNPKSVAIVGASSDPNKIGGRPLFFLKKAGFTGRVWPVNPTSKSVQGIDAVASISDIDGPVDQAIIAVAAAQVEQAIDACIRKGIGAVQIFTAGFAEIGDEGKRAQAAIRDKANAAGVRLLGPNSLGLFNVVDGFFGTFATALDGAWPKRGPIGIATQSGAFGSYAYGVAQGRGLGFSYFVATGNESDVDVAECIAWLVEDPHTRVIVAAFEGCQNGERLLDALDRAYLAGKPVIAMKAGASEFGAAAAASHTGSLAGSDAVWDAVFRRANVHRARSIEEMVDVAYACCTSAMPRGDRIGIITTSGGVGVLIADGVSDHGLRLPPMSDMVEGKIKEILPFASGRNPVDTSAQLMLDLGIFARMLDIMLASGEIDTVIGFLAHVGRNPAHFDRLRAPLYEVRKRHPEKLFILVMLADPTLRAELEAAGFLLFEDPTRAVAATAAATRLGQRPSERPAAVSFAVGGPTCERLEPGESLNELDAKELIARAGIPVLGDRVARSPSEAMTAASELGSPVVLKVLSSDIPHKSDIGAVLLGLSNDQEVADGFKTIIARARQAAPDARIDGVMVSPMLQGGTETILGSLCDPTFGPVVMFGLGGIYVEVFRDVVFRPAPFGKDEALAMIRQTRGFALLNGARGRPPADLGSIAAALSSLSYFAYANRDRIRSVDINPFIALPNGGWAVDALIEPHEPGVAAPGENAKNPRASGSG